MTDDTPLSRDLLTKIVGEVWHIMAENDLRYRDVLPLFACMLARTVLDMADDNAGVCPHAMLAEGLDQVRVLATAALDAGAAPTLLH